ncbi:SET domain-containing protein [Spongiibacter sp.]|uniref:SET domain-containing protein n=1 Tax=Spongiibacter sp. TaxID=2024860 RepID=UPI003569FF91
MFGRRAFTVRRSALHGKGLFARRPIAVDTVIGWCKTKPTVKPGLHTLSLEDGRDVDICCALRYINHGRPANVIYYDDFSVVALRDIEAGEELLHDYGEDWP